MKRTAVIMAGGSGERFWPVSRKHKPKQLLKLSSEDKTMIEESIERIAPAISPEDVFIITGAHLLEPIRKALPMLPPENIVAEPYKRNTAPCLALSASFIRGKYSSDGINPENISVAVLTADQSIRNMEGFLKTVDTALNYVEKNPVLATIGINPDRPETGYGYIEVGSPFSVDDPNMVKDVIRFTEKPDVDKAREFLDSGKYLWNSGMFFWRLDTFIKSMEDKLPEVGSQIINMAEKYEGNTNKAFDCALESIDSLFHDFPNTSIDYGLMERADNVVVVKADFSWDDIGSWDSLDRIRDLDTSGNISSGNIVSFDMKNSVMINESEKDIVVSAFGLDNIVLVVTDDAILACPKDRVQEVKKSVETIRDKFGDKFL